MKAAILTDTTKCIGCNECLVACKKVNHLPPDVPRRWDSDDGLTATNWTSIVRGPGDVPVRKQCRHCLEPACASACPVGAMHKTDIGAVTYDRAKCIGCRYCMMACPYGIPRYEWQQAAPSVRKCILCYDRIKSGGQPSCVEACPTKATIFGDRDELIAEAHRRIAQNPSLYLKKVWGEHDAGGSSVVYVSGIDLSFLTEGRQIGSSPLPATTSTVMEAVPPVFTGVIGAMAGIGWVIERRIRLRKAKSAEKEHADE